MHGADDPDGNFDCIAPGSDGDGRIDHFEPNCWYRHTINNPTGQDFGFDLRWNESRRKSLIADSSSVWGTRSLAKSTPAILNGDFEFGEDLVDISECPLPSTDIAGWTAHSLDGGNGKLRKRATTYDSEDYYLLLDNFCNERTTNRFYLPVSAQSLRFDLRRFERDDDDELIVRMGNITLATIPLNATDSDFHPWPPISLPSSIKQEEIQTLTFDIVDRTGVSITTANVGIDNVEIESAPLLPATEVIGAKLDSIINSSIDELGLRLPFSTQSEVTKADAPLFNLRSVLGQIDKRATGTIEIAADLPPSGPNLTDIEILFSQSGSNSNPVPATEFDEFLVGSGRPAIDVIVANTGSSNVSWEITAIGSHSGTIPSSSGTGSSFQFTPDISGSRPTDGASPKHIANEPIAYSITVSLPSGESETVIVVQNDRARLRQEYLDFGLDVPAIEDVGVAIETTNFQGSEFSRFSNYAPLVVNGGMASIAQSIRDQYGAPLIVTSGYRNPQRNKAVGGVGNSIHMSGGAVDLVPVGKTISQMVSVYRAAVAVDPGLVLLEDGPRQLLPSNWIPPNADHVFQLPGSTAELVVEDSDDDGLPDRIKEIRNATNGLSESTTLDFDGGSSTNPAFVIVGDQDGIAEVGERVHIQWQPPNVAGFQQHNPLSHYFVAADHVHADNRGNQGLRQRSADQLLGDTASRQIVVDGNDASFVVRVDAGVPKEVHIPSSDTVDNSTLVDLAIDANIALARSGLERSIEASSTLDSLVFKTVPAAGVQSFTLATLRMRADGGQAAPGIGPANGRLSSALISDASASTNELKIVVTRSSPSIDGSPPNLADTTYEIALPKSQGPPATPHPYYTDDNVNLQHLADDLNLAFVDAGLSDVVTFVNVGIDGQLDVNPSGSATINDRLVLAASDPNVVGIHVFGTGSALELGFANGQHVNTATNNNPAQTVLGFYGERVAVDPASQTIESQVANFEAVLREMSMEAGLPLPNDYQLTPTYSDGGDLLTFRLRLNHVFEKPIELDFFDEGIDLDGIGLPGTLEVAALADATLTAEVKLDFEVGFHLGDAAPGFTITDTKKLSELNGGEGIGRFVGMTAAQPAPSDGQLGQEVALTLSVGMEGLALAKDSTVRLKVLDPTPGIDGTGDNLDVAMLKNDLNDALFVSGLSDLVEADIYTKQTENINGQITDTEQFLVLRGIDESVTSLAVSGANTQLLGFASGQTSDFADIIVGIGAANSSSDSDCSDNNCVVPVNLDGVDDILELKSAIQSATGVVVTIDDSGQALKLSAGGPLAIIEGSEPRLEIVNKDDSSNNRIEDSFSSLAGSGLGILGVPDPSATATESQVITGDPLHGATTRDRIFIVPNTPGTTDYDPARKNIEIDLSVVLTKLDVSAARGTLNFELRGDPSNAGPDIELGILVGTNFKDPGANDGRIYLSESFVSPLQVLVLNPTEIRVQPHGEANLGLAAQFDSDAADLVRSAAGESDPFLKFSIKADARQIATERFVTKFEANPEALIRELNDFTKNISNFVQALRDVGSLLKANVGDGFNKPIPLLNKSPSELVAIGDAILDVAESIVTNPDVATVEAAVRDVESAVASLGLAGTERRRMDRAVGMLKRVLSHKDEIDATGQPRFPALLLSAARQFTKAVYFEVLILPSEERPAGTDALIAARDGLLDAVPSLASLEKNLSRAAERALRKGLKLPPDDETFSFEFDFGIVDDFDGDGNADVNGAPGEKDRAIVVGFELRDSSLVSESFNLSIPASDDSGLISIQTDPKQEKAELHLGGGIGFGFAYLLDDPTTTADDNVPLNERILLVVDPKKSEVDDVEIHKTGFDLNFGVDFEFSPQVRFGKLKLIQADIDLSVLRSELAVFQPPFTEFTLNPPPATANLLKKTPSLAKPEFIIVTLIDPTGAKVLASDQFDVTGNKVVIKDLNSLNAVTEVTVEYHSASTSPFNDSVSASNLANQAKLKLDFRPKATIQNTIGAVSLADFSNDVEFVADAYVRNPQDGSRTHSGLLVGSVDATSITGGQANDIVSAVISLNHVLQGNVDFDTEALGSLFTVTEFDLKTIVVGVENLLDTIEVGLTSDIVSKLPVVGGGLDTAATFIGKLRTDLVVPLRNLICTVGGNFDEVANSIETLIVDKLGPSGLNILKDRDGDGVVGAGPRHSDVKVRLNRDEFEIEFGIHGEDKQRVDFNSGLAGLPLDAPGQGGVEFGYEYDIDLGFGVNRKDGFYLLANPTDWKKQNEFEFTIGAGLAVSEVNGIPMPTSIQVGLFGFDFSATDNLRGGEAGTGVFGTLTLDIRDIGQNDRKVSFSDLGSVDLADAFWAELAARASIDVTLNAGFGGSNVPSFQTDVVLDWGLTFGNRDTGEFEFKTDDLKLALERIGVNLGDFLNRHVGAALKKLDTVLSPLVPLITQLKKEAPVVSQVSELAGKGKKTYFDLAIAEVSKEEAKAARLFFEAVDTLIDLRKLLDTTDPDEVVLILRDRMQFFPAPQADDPNKDVDPNSIATESGSTQILEVDEKAPEGTAAAVEQKTADKVRGAFKKLEKLGIKLHFLEVANIVKFAMGQEFDIISWDIPRLELKFPWEESFKIVPFPPISARIGLDATIFADLSVGFDSNGRTTGNFFDGFYVGDEDDESNSVGSAEFGLEVGLRLAAFLDAVIAKAGIEAEVRASILADWANPDKNGRFHLNEIASIVKADGPLCLFDLRGELRGIVRLIWEINYVAGKQEGSKELFNEILFSFMHECPVYKLGHVVEGATGTQVFGPDIYDTNGTLVVHIGEFSGLRRPGKSFFDISDDVVITQLAPNTMKIEMHEREQTFTDVHRIYFSGGLGNDVLTLIDVDVPMTVMGGPGDDILVGTDQGDYLDGGVGDDYLRGRAGDDEILGGSGNDVIFGDIAPDALISRASDTAWGDSGEDTISGGAGEDIIYGGKLTDTIDGGGGSDIIFGGSGDDELNGGSGSDALVGGFGADTLTGDSGNDILFGDLVSDDSRDSNKNDRPIDKRFTKLFDDFTESLSLPPLFFGTLSSEKEFHEALWDYDASAIGTTGSDSLHGRTGNDLLIGDGNSDILLGGWGDDALLGHWIGVVDDTSGEYFEGGPDNDFICGANGRDRIFGGTNSTTTAPYASLDDVLADRGLGISGGGFTVSSCSEETVITVESEPVFAISGMLFDDSNRDGNQSTAESGLGSWSLELLDDQAQVIATTKTRSSDGGYEFGNVNPGQYAVRPVVQTGWLPTTWPSGSQTITVDGNSTLPTIDGVKFGHRREQGKITARTFLDVNGNGMRESTDPWMDNWQIEIVNEEGSVIRRTESIDKNADGQIQSANEKSLAVFDGLPAGDYIVREYSRGGWHQSAPHLDVSIGGTMDVRLGIPDDEISELRSGLTVTGLNGAGGVSRLTNVSITLDVEHPNVGDLGTFLITPSGERLELFNNVGGSGNNYESTMLHGYSATSDRLREPDGTELHTAPYSLSSGYQAFDNLDELVGIDPRGEWTLVVSDGVEGNFGTLNDWSLSIGEETTDANGFSANGTTVYAAKAPSTYQSRHWNEYHVTLETDQEIVVEFGNYQLGSVHGYKFRDDNGNGLQESGESGYGGITLFVDANQNGIRDRGESQGITQFDNPNTDFNEEGYYTIGSVPPGTYEIREELSSEYFQTLPLDDGVGSVTPQIVVLGSGEIIGHSPQDIAADSSLSKGIVFGNQPLDEVHGTKWIDVNGDGVRGDNEPGMSGVRIYADLNADGMWDPNSEPSTLTMSDDESTEGIDETGEYWLTGLKPATGQSASPRNYIIREVVPSGFEQISGGWKPIYQSDFEDMQPLAAWNSQETSPTPIDGRTYLGPFDNETAQLQLNNLPDHDRLLVEFDLFVLGDWDANELHIKHRDAAGQVTPLFSTSFSNASIGDLEPEQSFPEALGGLLSAPHQGAREIQTLGWKANPGNEDETIRDSVYHLVFEFAHADEFVEFVLESDGLDGIAEGEAWGIDNVLVGIPSDAHYVTVDPGGVAIGRDFGNTSPTGITGQKWNDLNRDGVRDANEPALDGWEIEVFDPDGNFVDSATTGSIDLNGDGVIDPVEETGVYWIELPLGADNVGRYVIREVGQADWTQTFPEPVVIGDLNSDGVFDFSDFLLMSSRAGQPSTYQQGDYNFDGIFDVEDLRIAIGVGGFGRPSPDEETGAHYVTLTPANPIGRGDFGNSLDNVLPVEVHGVVWEDDGDGIRQGNTSEPVFFVSQGDAQSPQLYRFGLNGSVDTFPLTDGIAGMTVVPDGVTVGDTAGGASAGDILALADEEVYRINDPFGTPSLVLIGEHSSLYASPVFIGDRLFVTGGRGTPSRATLVEWNTTNFQETSLWDLGFQGSPGGIVSADGNQELIFSEFSTGDLHHYMLGDSNSNAINDLTDNNGDLLEHSYDGLEMFEETLYASFGVPNSKSLLFGSIDESATFTELRNLSSHDVPAGLITGLAILPRAKAGESGISGVPVYADISPVNGMFDLGEPIATSMRDNPSTPSDESGQYWLTGLPTGSVTIRQVVPSGFEQVHPTSTGHLLTGLSSGDVVDNVDFGNRRSLSNGNTNSPGTGVTQAPQRQKAQAKSVRLIAAAADIGMPDELQRLPTFVAHYDCFQFGDSDFVEVGVRANDEFVGRVDVQIVKGPAYGTVGDSDGNGILDYQPRAIHGYDSFQYKLVYTNEFSEVSESNVTTAFLSQAGCGAEVHGQKWNDANANRNRIQIVDDEEEFESDEFGLDGWVIRLVGPNGFEVETVTSSVDLNEDGKIDPFTEQGLYWFKGLPFGDYTVSELLQPGWIQTIPNATEEREAGDINEDGVFDLADWDKFTEWFTVLSTPGTGGIVSEAPTAAHIGWHQGDFNGDNLLNTADVLAALQSENFSEPAYFGDEVRQHRLVLDPESNIARDIDFANYEAIPIDDGDDIIFAGDGVDIVYGDNLIADPLYVTRGTNKDTLYGEAGNDRLFGQEKADILWGAGPDMLDQVTEGNDSISGGPGMDRVMQTVQGDQTLTDTSLTGQGVDSLASVELATLSGGDDPNTITATAFTGDVFLNGKGDEDWLYAGSGNDWLDGGEGDDHLFGRAGNDSYLFSSLSSETVEELSGNGEDTLDFSTLPVGVSVDLRTLTPTSQIVTSSLGKVSVSTAGLEQHFENIVGTDHDDVIYGNASSNRIDARLANSLDEVFGVDGNDVYVVAPQWGTLAIVDSGGEDTLDMSLISDSIDFFVNSSKGVQIVSSDPTAATHEITNTANTIEHFIGGSMDDRFIFVDGTTLPINSSVDAGPGVDLLDYAGFNVATDVDLLTGTATGISTTAGSVAGFENVIGGDKDDRIRGNAQSNELRGGEGSDSIWGEGGADFIYGENGDDIELNGGVGNDEIYGGSGRDFNILGGSGNDKLYPGPGFFDNANGGEGSDIYFFADDTELTLVTENGTLGNDVLDFSAVTGGLNSEISATQNVTITSPGRGVSSTPAIEEIIGSTGDDAFRITGIQGLTTVRLDGREGRNSIDYSQFTGSCSTIVTGTCVNLSDVLQSSMAPGSATGTAGLANISDVIGSTNNDHIVGSDERNHLYGGVGNDTIWGNSGDDVLFAGPGVDELYGGRGSDRFVVDPAFTMLTLHEEGGVAVEGLVSAGGLDTIDFSTFGVPIKFDLTLNSQNPVSTTGSPQLLLRFDDGSATKTAPDNSAIQAANNFENVIGSSNASNQLTGNMDPNLLIGGSADDVLVGAAGDDFLVGLGGADSLDGNSGDDVLIGGSGTDGADSAGVNRVFDGGVGFDILVGGLDVDEMDGGLGEDIVIGGSTAYDDIGLTGDDREAWNAIRLAWVTATDQQSRIAAIESGVGSSSSIRLETTGTRKTVDDDFEVDRVFADILDWVFD